MKLLLSFFLMVECAILAAAAFADEKLATASLPRNPTSVGAELLTPTNGVDFTAYVKELFGKVRRNWFAVMPESAQLGEKGKIIVRFQILPDGKLQESELTIESASGKEELRRASIAAIEKSSPFRPLPKAFEGPFIEMRFTFLYNLPVSAAKP